MKIAHKTSNMFQTFPFLKKFKFPKTATIVEVGPRDGLQNEKIMIPTDKKIKMINSLSQCGFKKIETTSFVSPKWVPQMGDNTQVFQGIEKNPSTTYTVLVPNLKGLEQAMLAGVNEVALFIAASETFSKKNTNCTIEESLKRVDELIPICKEKNIKVRGYISCVMGCPYEGDIDPSVVNTLTHELLNRGCYEISLGDTIGIGTPEKTIKLMETLTSDKTKLAAHYHNTYDRAIENIIISMYYGINVFDSSIAGLGGCPYAKGATGNVPTEDVLFLCELLGIKTEVNIKETINLGKFIIGEFGYEKRTSVGIEDLDAIPKYQQMLV